MRTRETQYDGSGDRMGEWNDPDAAAEYWNKYIAPVLRNYTDNEMFEADERPTISTAPGCARYADEWAWDEFSGRGAGDDEAVARALGAELLDKLS